MTVDHKATVREAVVEDAGTVHAVLLAAFEPLRHLYTAGAFDATVLDPQRVVTRLDQGPIWITEANGVPVGTFAATDGEWGCHLRGMGVVPDARGLGAGQALIDAAVGHALRAGRSRSWLYTTPFLDAAIRLYERAGFVRFAEHPPPHLHGTPLVGMERHSKDRRTNSGDVGSASE